MIRARLAGPEAWQPLMPFFHILQVKKGATKDVHNEYTKDITWCFHHPWPLTLPSSHPYPTSPDAHDPNQPNPAMLLLPSIILPIRWTFHQIRIFYMSMEFIGVRRWKASGWDDLDLSTFYSKFWPFSGTAAVKSLK